MQKFLTVSPLRASFAAAAVAAVVLALGSGGIAAAAQAPASSMRTHVVQSGAEAAAPACMCTHATPGTAPGKVWHYDNTQDGIMSPDWSKKTR